MPNGQYTIEQLGQQVKAKYPQYASMDDNELKAVRREMPAAAAAFDTDHPSAMTSSNFFSTGLRSRVALA